MLISESGNLSEITHETKVVGLNVYSLYIRHKLILTNCPFVLLLEISISTLPPPLHTHLNVIGEADLRVDLSQKLFPMLVFTHL